MNFLFKKRIILVIIAILVLSVSLTACGKKDKNTTKISYGDIYLSNGEVLPYSTSELVVELGKNISPYYTVDNHGNRVLDDAYIKNSDLLKCMKTEEVLSSDGKTTITKKYYGIYKLDEKEFIGDGVVYKDFLADKGFLVLVSEDRLNNSIINIYDYLGNLIIPHSKVVSYLPNDVLYDGSNIKKLIIPLSEDYFAFLYRGRYKIIHKSGKEIRDGNDEWALSGEYVGPQKVFNLQAVDNYIIKTLYGGTFTKAVSNALVYDINTCKEIYNAFENYGDFSGDMTRSLTYLGNGQVYCYQNVKVKEADDHTYFLTENDNSKSFYKAYAWTYDLKSGTKKIANSNNIFISIVNKYNTTNTGLDINEFLKDGYSYVSLSYDYNSDKSASVEQYIIDSNLNTYVSMISHKGCATNYDKYSDKYRDVLLRFVGNVGYSPDAEGNIYLYDNKGSTILKIDGNFSDVQYNNGIVTAYQTFLDNGKEVKYFSAFTIDGTPIFDAFSQKYTKGTPFVGGYAICKNESKNTFMIDKNGTETSINDVVINNGDFVYKTGVYSTKGKDANGNNAIGLKSVDGKTILEYGFYQTFLQKTYNNNLYCYALSTKDNGVWRIYKIK